MVLSNTLPNTDDSIGITLMKILQVINGNSSGSGLWIDFTTAPTSATPGIEGNYGAFAGNLYIYTGGAWYSTILNVVP